MEPKLLFSPFWSRLLESSMWKLCSWFGIWETLAVALITGVMAPPCSCIKAMYWSMSIPFVFSTFRKNFWAWLRIWAPDLLLICDSTFFQSLPNNFKAKQHKIRKSFFGSSYFWKHRFWNYKPNSSYKKSEAKIHSKFFKVRMTTWEVKCSTQVVLCLLALTSGTHKKRYVFYLLHILIWYFGQFWKIWKIAL